MLTEPDFVNHPVPVLICCAEPSDKWSLPLAGLHLGVAVACVIHSYFLHRGAERWPTTRIISDICAFMSVCGATSDILGRHLPELAGRTGNVIFISALEPQFARVVVVLDCFVVAWRYSLIAQVTNGTVGMADTFPLWQRIVTSIFVIVVFLPNFVIEIILPFFIDTNDGNPAARIKYYLTVVLELPAIFLFHFIYIVLLFRVLRHANQLTPASVDSVAKRALSIASCTTTGYILAEFDVCNANILKTLFTQTGMHLFLNWTSWTLPNCFCCPRAYLQEELDDHGEEEHTEYLKLEH
jgi:hypothetical protein